MTTAQFTPGQRTVSLDQAYKLALDHHAAGRRADAEAVAAQIIKTEPRHAFAWQLLANEAGNRARAIKLMGKAIQHHPMVSQFYANRAEMNRLAGHLEQAVADGEQAVRLAPRSAAARSNLGIAWYHLGELEKAEACQKEALRQNANYLPALNNLGSICRDRKDPEGAVGYYRKVLPLRPGFVESANNLGATLVEMDDHDGGLRILLDVIRQNPNYAEAHCNVGNAFIAKEDFAKAQMAFTNTLRLNPDHVEAMEGLARCLQETRELEKAEELVRKALSIRERAAGWALLANILSERMFPEQSAECYEKALSMAPALVSAWIGKGHLLMEQGKMEESEACFRRALELEPDNIAPRLSNTQVAKTSEGDKNLAALEKAAPDSASMPETKALSLHFALGKAYEDLKRHDDAFPHFLQGCALKR